MLQICNWVENPRNLEMLDCLRFQVTWTPWLSTYGDAQQQRMECWQLQNNLVIARRRKKKKKEADLQYSYVQLCIVIFGVGLTYSPTTMKLVGYVNKQEVVVLID
ncbi:hypothetical protein Dimus_019449 [Dionaea muscipula]